jgi:hypothetical protein
LKGESKSNSNNNDNNDNNNPTSQHSQKGNDLGQIEGGESTATKKGSNNDNRPTHPPCSDKVPIPPNCTLKPKF